MPAMILVAIASAAVTAFVLRYFMQNSRRPYRRQRPRYFES